MKKFLSTLYLVGLMVLTLYFISIIWKVTFAHIIEEYQHRKEIVDIKQFKQEQERKEKKTPFEKVILESEERIKHYLGYRVLEEQRIEGHFHHIGIDIGPDKRSYCVLCHGDMPHDAVKEIRAFLNMHAFFLACQTCHVKLERTQRTGVFKWYDRTTGEIVDSPAKTSFAGMHKAKIIPFEYIDGRLERTDSQERINFVLEYKKRESTLSDNQKSRAKRMVHEVVSKQPYDCEDCHRKDSPLLPFEALGYPEERINSITSTEVVGMIKNYTKFYMPRMLHPGEELEPKRR